ncbi:Carboxylesterase family [Aspergillus sclerotialis]|uniref:Carboxylic ester hydrolase n=1 Tax=Aspergillus sclerotialis TaxID=2070753 RepID=A0A3A2ZHU6_9EURO|nr:Carboxylesterase family [Aspergillus sclerotialis]
METTENITIHLPGGAILAQKNDKLIRARGIKYAHARRFEKPRAATCWDGVQDCTQPASVCVQNPSRLGPVTGNLEGNRIQSEECLHVSVVAPSSARAAPVMVFLHGGAYVTGGGDVDAYSPHALASRGVVAVTVTYRLGVFGYLPIPNLAPANLGFLDQIEALRWVQKNIEAFGGDPTNVTLFGQSAGADAIYCLMVADDTEDLFHRAIMQSLPLGRLSDENRHEMTRTMSQHAIQRPSIENLATAPVSALLDLQKQLLGVARSVSPALLPFVPVFGQYPLPTEDRISSRFISAARRKALFLGYTADEGTAFRHFASSAQDPPYFYNLFQGSTDGVIEQISRELGQVPPSYEVRWYPKGNNDLRATHCLELPFILGDWYAWKEAPMLQGANSQEVVEKVGAAVKDLWVAFARGEDFADRKFIIDENFHFP